MKLFMIWYVVVWYKYFIILFGGKFMFIGLRFEIVLLIVNSWDVMCIDVLWLMFLNN